MAAGDFLQDRMAAKLGAYGTVEEGVTGKLRAFWIAKGFADGCLDCRWRVQRVGVGLLGSGGTVMDECVECGEVFPGDVTHGRCPRCGAKLHVAVQRQEPPPQVDDGSYYGESIFGKL